MIIQIEIQDNNLQLPARKFYPVGLSGRYNAKLIGITFADKVLGTSNRIISIRSDCFKTIYGQTIKFLNQSVHVNHGFQGDYKFILEPNAGQVDIELSSNIEYDGLANSEFDVCLLSLDVELIEN